MCVCTMIQSIGLFVSWFTCCEMLSLSVLLLYFRYPTFKGDYRSSQTTVHCKIFTDYTNRPCSQRFSNIQMFICKYNCTVYMHNFIQYERGLCGVGSCSYGRRESVCRTSIFVVKALKDFVEQMSDHNDLLQSVCCPVWTGLYSICH